MRRLVLGCLLRTMHQYALARASRDLSNNMSQVFVCVWLPAGTRELFCSWVFFGRVRTSDCSLSAAVALLQLSTAQAARVQGFVTLRAGKALLP